MVRVDGVLDAVAAGIADRYVIERELGRGGMATVYLARDIRHDRRVAIKVLRPDLTASLSAERFLREVRVAARLNHAHIVALYESGRVATTHSTPHSNGDLLYYVMPYVQGESLRDRLRRAGALPVAEAVQIAREVADALAFAHEERVIHRDIKPENILLAGKSGAGSGTWHALVADFGVARLLADGDAGLTATGTSIGTPAYMSPEQAGGDRAIDARTDIYSLGCVLYEMLVGEPPFTGPNASAIIARHLSAPIPSIRTVRPTVTAELETLVRSALEKVPADRIPNAATFKANLDRIAVYLHEEGRPGRAGGAGTRPLWIGALAGAALAATLGAYFLRPGTRRAVLTPASLPATSSATLSRSRIVVMPLKLIGDTSATYLTEASTDELISALSRVGGLRVLARSSVQSVQSTGDPHIEIARALSAGSMVEGTFTKTGDSIRYDVTLVDVNSGEHVWGEHYLRQQRDVSGLQDSVARAVAARVLSAVSGAPTGLSRVRVSGPAHDAYLHGVYLARRGLSRPSSAALEDSAVMYFERALAIDPEFALAHAAVAGVYTARFFNYDPSPEWEQRAFSAVEKALAIDPTLPEAYQAKGNLTWTRANGFPHEAAAKYHRKAAALKPSLVEPHQSLGSLYMHVGLLDRALTEYSAALDLDPATVFVPPRVARVHWYQGQYELALRELEAIDRPLASFAAERALILNYLGRSSDALAFLADTKFPQQQSYDADAARAVIHASRGERELSLAAISRALAGGEQASHFHHAEYSIAEAYALLGEKDKAIEFLKKTVADGMPCYPLFKNDPHLRSLAGDPRFVQFMSDVRGRTERLAKTLE